MASLSDMARGGFSPGYSYYKKEKKDYATAKGLYGTATPEEQALAAQQLEAVRQAYEDRKNTRDLILAQMGFKIGKDDKGGQTLVPLTHEERLKMMTEAEKSKSEAAGAYQERAKAAASGTSKLPSFLKKDIDYQKVKEEALLGELLGPEALQTTAGQQAVEALRKKEEAIRQQLQEQDLATAPGAAMGLSGQLNASRNQRIGQMEQLPNLNQNLIAGRGSLLNQMQGIRLDQYKKALADLENKRQMITSFYTLGGTVGGAAATAANNRKTNPDTRTSNYGYGGYNPQPTYDPYSDTSSPYLIGGKEYDATY